MKKRIAQISCLILALAGCKKDTLNPNAAYVLYHVNCQNCMAKFTVAGGNTQTQNVISDWHIGIKLKDLTLAKLAVSKTPGYQQATNVKADLTANGVVNSITAIIAPDDTGSVILGVGNPH
jgi:hypothetical protein